MADQKGYVECVWPRTDRTRIRLKGEDNKQVQLAHANHDAIVATALAAASTNSSVQMWFDDTTGDISSFAMIAS